MPMNPTEHEIYNAQHFPGTRQLCDRCGEPTGRCEEDAILDSDGYPLCGDCAEDERPKKQSESPAFRIISRDEYIVPDSGWQNNQSQTKSLTADTARPASRKESNGGLRSGKRDRRYNMTDEISRKKLREENRFLELRLQQTEERAEKAERERDEWKKTAKNTQNGLADCISSRDELLYQLRELFEAVRPHANVSKHVYRECEDTEKLLEQHQEDTE